MVEAPCARVTTSPGSLRDVTPAPGRRANEVPSSFGAHPGESPSARRLGMSNGRLRLRVALTLAPGPRAFDLGGCVVPGVERRLRIPRSSSDR